MCSNSSLKYILSDGNCSFCAEGEFLQGGSCLNCSNGQTFNTTLQRCICNETANLYWNSQSCILCEHPQYWDYGDLQCLNCPA